MENRKTENRERGNERTTGRGDYGTSEAHSERAAAKGAELGGQDAQDWPGQAGDSEVVGSMTRRTCATLLAGKPPWRACSRTICSLGAM